MKALIDTCVLIDVFQAREPFLKASRATLLACGNGNLTGLTTAKAMTDVYYLMHGYFHDRDKSVEIVRKLYDILDVADTTARECLEATFSSVSDYEDAVMDKTARAEGADFIVTRNLRDYRNAETPAISPEALVGKLGLDADGMTASSADRTA